MKKINKLFIMALVAALFVSVMPIRTVHAEGAVAKIGDTEYETLDEAITAATNGDTIVILQDCDFTADLNQKDLIIDGDGHTISRENCINVKKNVTIKNATFNMVISTSSASPWMAMNFNGVFTLDNTKMLMDASGSSANLHGIYATGGNSTINVTNGSTLTINGFKQDAIEWDGTYRYELNVTGDSKYVATNNRSAITGTWYVTVTDSTMTWEKCSGNGSNGAHFYFTNSTFSSDTCGAHGLSTGNLSIKNSSVVSKNAKYAGIVVGGQMYVDGTSTVTADSNGSGYTGAGIKLSSKTATNTIEKGAVVTITNNLKNALENYGNTTFADGAVLTIKDNYNNKDNGGGIYNGGTLVLPANAVITNNKAEKTGGGICNAGTITLGDNVQLYNNHAGTAGDDLFQRATGKITNLTLGSDWALDGTPDCSEAIDGWYLDMENDRWSAHKLDSTPWEYTVKLGEISGESALKAAHGLAEITVIKEWDDADNQDGIRPETITVVVSGDNGFSQELTLAPNADGVWTATTEKTPDHTVDGKVTFTITEVSNEESKYTPSVTNEGNVYTLKNSYTPETIDITVNKEWYDNDDQDGLRDSYGVTLYANGDPVGDEVILDKETLTYTWEGVAKYDDGELIVYTIKETTVPEGYEASYETEVEYTTDGGTITNVHTPETTDITVKKVWDDGDDANQLRDSYGVTLYANGEPVGKEVTLDAETLEYTWKDLPVYADGKKIEYTVKETTVPEGYEATVEDLTITNTHDVVWHITICYWDITGEIVSLGTDVVIDNIPDGSETAKVEGFLAALEKQFEGYDYLYFALEDDTENTYPEKVTFSYYIDVFYQQHEEPVLEPEKYTVTVNYYDIETGKVIATQYVVADVEDASKFADVKDIEKALALEITDYTKVADETVVNGTKTQTTPETVTEDIVIDLYYKVNDVPETGDKMMLAVGTMGTSAVCLAVACFLKKKCERD